MLERIPIYELPFPDKENLALKIYRVKGSKIQRKDYPHDTVLPHKHNYFEICVFTNGEGDHEIDFCTYPIQSQSIHVLHPGQVHLIRRGENYSGYLIVFSKTFYNLQFGKLEIISGYPLITRLENGPILNMNSHEFADFEALITSIEKEYEKTSSETDKIIISYLNIFFLRLRRQFSSMIKHEETISNPYQTLVYRFNQLVDQHFHEVHQVGEYAELLNESPVVLNRAVKSLSGKTAGELIAERIILEAKRLLLYSELSNKEVAFKLNYDDPAYFSRIFKRKTGVTPTEFRQRVRMHYKK